MEWTTQDIALDNTAKAKMSAQVRTIRIDTVDFTILCAKQHKLFAKILDCLYVAGSKFLGFEHTKPTERQGKRNSLTHKKDDLQDTRYTAPTYVHTQDQSDRSIAQFLWAGQGL